MEEQSVMSPEEALNSFIEEFYLVKEELSKYKKISEEDNEKIKQIMENLDIKEYKTNNGITAKIVVQNKEKFNEPKLIEKLKILNGFTAIKTVEVVDMDELENLIYNGHIDAGQLADCKETNQVVTLRVSKKKGA